MLLTQIAAAFVVGLFAAQFFLYFPISTITIFFLCSFFKLFSKKRQQIPVCLLIVCGIGFLFPSIHSRITGRDDLSQWINRGPIRMIASIDHPPQHAPDKVVVQMKAMAILKDGKSIPVFGLFRLTIYQSDTDIAYGDILEMDIALRSPMQFGNPGGFLFSDYLERKGLFAVASLSGKKTERIKKNGESGFPLLKSIYRFREEIRKKIVSDIESPVGPILLAMVVGETGYLTDPIRDAFTDSGTNHILSISGSHLAMVSFFVFGCARYLLLRLPVAFLLRLSLIKIPSQWAALITAVTATFYVLLSGSAVATVRSLIMILAYLFSIFWGRTSSVKQAISLAALLILMVDPQAIFDISFQLSFLAILSIVLAAEWWEALYPKSTGVQNVALKFKQAAITMQVASVAATFATMPLTLYYFHQFSLFGILSNFIVIPFTGFLILPLGWLSSLVSPFVPVFPLAAFNSVIGKFYFQIVSFFAALPYANLHFASPHLLMVALFLLTFFVLLIKRVSLYKIIAVLSFSCIVFLVVGALRFTSESLQVTFLDVGQGDGALIEFPNGETMLVDAGSGMPIDLGKAAILPFLWEKKIKTIDYVVETHPQMDHIGGLTSIIQKFEVKKLFVNGIVPDAQFYKALMERVQKNKMKRQVVNEDTMPLEIGGCRIVFLHPTANVSPYEKKMNDHSIVFRLSCPMLSDAAFLFTGDIERQAIDIILSDNDLSQTDILKVPHHGAKNGVSGWLLPKDQFIKKVAPKIAIFSVGKNNRYGHPHKDAILAYQQIGAKIYRTDQDGAITVTLHPNNALSVRSFREAQIQKVRWGKGMFLEEIENIKKGLFLNAP
ncbi:MAG: DNA internalization-related competence protein ComEC/Rec2 [Nitrospirota bacterium]